MPVDARLILVLKDLPLDPISLGLIDCSLGLVLRVEIEEAPLGDAMRRSLVIRLIASRLEKGIDLGV